VPQPEDFPPLPSTGKTQAKEASKQTDTFGGLPSSTQPPMKYTTLQRPEEPPPEPVAPEPDTVTHSEQHYQGTPRRKRLTFKDPDSEYPESSEAKDALHNARCFGPQGSKTSETTTPSQKSTYEEPPSPKLEHPTAPHSQPLSPEPCDHKPQKPTPSGSKDGFFRFYHPVRTVPRYWTEGRLWRWI
jgi:hypothetical protein